MEIYMQLKKLHTSFYSSNPIVHNALDYYPLDSKWDTTKERGHGVVKITINGLTFAIPVRSHVTHNASLILEVNRKVKHIKGMGLDYSKALLIKDESYISDEVFVLRTKEAGKKLLDKEAHLTKMFNSYVEKYITAFNKKDQNILRSPEYIETTLVNYHEELGITVG
jgi:protein AbiQ